MLNEKIKIGDKFYKLVEVEEEKRFVLAAQRLDLSKISLTIINDMGKYAYIRYENRNLITISDRGYFDLIWGATSNDDQRSNCSNSKGTPYAVDLRYFWELQNDQ